MGTTDTTLSVKFRPQIVNINCLSERMKYEVVFLMKFYNLVMGILIYFLIYIMIILEMGSISVLAMLFSVGMSQHLSVGKGRTGNCTG